MKSLYKSVYILFLTFFIIVSCKKESNTANIKLTESDSGKTISVLKGEVVYITLSNPGDGGYVLNNPKYDSSILILNSHNHQNPTNTNLMGDFGQDIWKLTGLETGTTILTISASRSGSVSDTISLFKSKFNVK